MPFHSFSLKCYAMALRRQWHRLFNEPGPLWGGTGLFGKRLARRKIYMYIGGGVLVVILIIILLILLL
jgi:Tfp pilus assembly protein PilN